MGWWENIEGHQVGDIVADAFAEIVQKIKAKHPDITLEDFLHAMRQTANASAELVSDAEQLPIREVVAKLDDAERTVVHPSERELVGVVELLSEGFAGTSFIFEETFERKPSLGEIFSNLNFVLPRGDEYFSFQPDVAILYFQAR